MGDTEDANAGEISDQDDLTPPVVNNTIVHKEKSKDKSKSSRTEKSKDKSKTSSTEKSKDKSKTSSTEKSSKKSRRNSEEESGKDRADGVNVKVSSPSHPEKVKVIVRCRPISSKELEQGHIQVVKVDSKKHEIEVHRHNPSSSNLANAKHNKIFTFDNVYGESSTQADLYEEVFRSLVDSVLTGFNGTIFAYGQTGTGKTYTMEGVRDSPEHQGVIPQAFKHIFAKINAAPASQTYLVRASYLEIYQEEIRDLLFRGKTTCEIKESGGGVYVKDLSTNICRNFEEINEVMSKGNKNRSVGATNMNEHSSRSHAIFVITVEMSEMWDDGATHIKVGKLNLVDLAGSERQGKTGSEGDRLKEAVKINLSLSALGHVIGALAEGGHSHIPYRDSKLTRLLQDSLGGNSRTIMVATIGPASFNYDETMVTLRYASRAKRIKNKPKVNEDPKDAMLKMYQDEISKLKAQLEAKMQGQPSPRPGADIGSPNLDQLLGSVPKDRPKSRRNIPSARALANEDFDPALMKELSPYLSAYGLESITDPKEILRQLEEKKKALLMDKDKNQDEKDMLLEKLEATVKYVQKADDACARIRYKIEWLQSKTLNNGNKNKKLVELTNMQQKEIEIRKKELNEQAKAQEDLRKKFEEHNMSMSELRDMLNEKEAICAHRKRRVAKLKYQRDKMRETKAKREKAHNQEMAGKRAYLKKLEKELKGNAVMMDNFVPPKIKTMVEGLIRPNKSNDSLSMLPITSVVYPRPLVERMLLVPLYRKGKPIFKNWDFMSLNLYYTDENILRLHFDGPEPTTLMYTPPDSDPYISSLLQRALEDAESEVVVDCARFNTKRRRKATAKIRLGEVITVQGDLTVRPVISSKHRSKEILYKDFVVVARARPIPVSRINTAIPSQRSIRALPQSQRLLPPVPIYSMTTPEPRPTSSRNECYFESDEQCQGDMAMVVYNSTPEEYLRVPYTARYKDVLGDYCPESLQPVEIQRKMYIESTRTPRTVRIISPGELEQIAERRRQKMIQTGRHVSATDVKSIKQKSRISALIASCTSRERTSTAPSIMPAHGGNKTYRVHHPKTAVPNTQFDIEPPRPFQSSAYQIELIKSPRHHQQLELSQRFMPVEISPRLMPAEISPRFVPAAISPRFVPVEISAPQRTEFTPRVLPVDFTPTPRVLPLEFTPRELPADFTPRVSPTESMPLMPPPEFATRLLPPIDISPRFQRSMTARTYSIPTVETLYNSADISAPKSSRSAPTEEISPRAQTAKSNSPISSGRSSSSICSLRASLLTDRAQRLNENSLTPRTGLPLPEIDMDKSRLNYYPGRAATAGGTQPQSGRPQTNLQPMKASNANSNAAVVRTSDESTQPRASQCAFINSMKRPNTNPNAATPDALSHLRKSPYGRLSSMKRPTANSNAAAPVDSRQQRGSPYAIMKRTSTTSHAAEEASTPDDSPHTNAPANRRMGSAPSMVNPPMRFGQPTELLYKKPSPIQQAQVQAPAAPVSSIRESFIKPPNLGGY